MTTKMTTTDVTKLSAI